jgi:pyruvate/2-oxoglutarate dehydrogenase complex dihydrolipoamide dehydrogenase (E3) component
MKQVRARKHRISGGSRQGVEKALAKAPNCSFHLGHCSFVSSDSVEVGGEVLTGPRRFINVGARAAIPKISGLYSVPYFTKSSILEIDFCPKHLIVVGGSYVGLEFGQMFRRLGSEVSIIERS